MGNQHTGGIRMDNNQEDREVGQAVNARRTDDSAAMGTGLLEDGSDDDSGPVFPFRRLHQHSTDHPPLSQPTISEFEEDWALSDDDASDSERRQRLCRKRKLRLDMLARTRGYLKRRKGNLAGHTASEPLLQVLGITTDNKVEGDKEGDCTTAVATDSSSLTPADTVFLCNGNRAATPSDLFDTVKRNIRLGSTTYTCSYVTVSKGKPTREITKVYCCSMVSTSQGWVSKPSFREPKDTSPTDPKKCRGKLAGHFRRETYYFSPHGTVGHACQLQHGGRRSDVDFRPPLTIITAPPSWGISDMVIDQMITSLQSCSGKWWASLPGQGTSRQWLKRIGEASTPAELDLKRQIEDVMTPYFRYIKTIYPAMTAWKVGALRTKAGASSQYEKQDSTLHRDYSETVLDHPPQERPMSIIMALDSFLFLVKPPLPSNEDEYVKTMVTRGQAIVFTNEQLHAGGPNHEQRMVFRLFAYVVSDEADYPNTEVYPNTLRRQEKTSAARLDDGQRGYLQSSGRSRRSTQK